jgi:hypothetical protein
MFLLSLFTLFSAVNAAMFGVYSDSACQELLIPVLAYSDVCTWNTYSTAYALYLESCSPKKLNVQLFNASDSAFCKPFPVNETFTVSNKCNAHNDYFTKIIDASECEGANTTFNIVAHDTPDCSDGGLPFSVVLANNSCVGNSFAPSYAGASWDTKIFANDEVFLMDVFRSTNGTCQNELGLFGAKNYTGACLAPITGFYNTTFIQLFQAFPLNT